MSKTTILLKNVQFIDEQDNRNTGWISIEGHQIRSLGKGQPKDFPVDLVLDGQGLTVLPGFIDVHTHGALGHEMLGITEPGLQEMSRFLRQSRGDRLPGDPLDGFARGHPRRTQSDPCRDGQ